MPRTVLLFAATFLLFNTVLVAALPRCRSQIPETPAPPCLDDFQVCGDFGYAQCGARNSGCTGAGHRVTKYPLPVAKQCVEGSFRYNPNSNSASHCGTSGGFTVCWQEYACTWSILQAECVKSSDWCQRQQTTYKTWIACEIEG